MAQINISGSISSTGISILGNASVVFSTDADHTLSVSEYTNHLLEVTSSVSLTATRNIIAPLIAGQTFTVQNNTTGGQSIQIIGPTGTGVTIANGVTTLVICDGTGTNYLAVSSGGGGATGPAGGDLSGTYPNPTVSKIDGYSVNTPSLTIIQDGYILTWDSADGYWTALPAPAGFSAGGDLSGNAVSQVVQGLYSHPLASTAPVNSAVPVWDSTIYDIRQLTQDDILPGFSISSFTGGSTVEIGATVTNPAFTASYSSLPTSAQITNTDGTDSPLVLTTPFTSGTVVGSFHHTSATSVTFALTAIKGVTRTANQFITYQARSFGGVGAAGATSSVTASVNTAVLSTGDILANEGLHSSDVGQTYGSFSPSGQKIYLLLVGGSHTFKDGNGFTFPMNSPTAISFTNQNGAVVSMFLYESTNILSTPFTLTVST